MIKPYITIIIFLTAVVTSGCNDSKEANIIAAEKDENIVWAKSIKGQYVGKSFIKSKITGISYTYHIYLPASYAGSTDKVYSTIYILDGQWNFRTVANSVDSDERDVIVVAIEDGRRRNVDYRLPGAIRYLDFFKDEFLPLIESNYRMNANNRSFQGSSLAGVTSTALLFLDDHQHPLFKNYIAYDPAFWSSPKLMQDLIEKRLQKENRIDANLYLTSAFLFDTNHYVVMDFIESMKKYAIPGLTIHHEMYMVSHSHITWASIEDTLDHIYGEP